MSEPYEVGPDVDGWWVVEHFDAEGACEFASFVGPNAERRAREYAAWMNSDA